jgi:excisionase family DNA binding protein
MPLILVDFAGLLCTLTLITEQNKMDDKYYTPQEVAALLQVDKVTVYRWIRAKRLGAIRVGNQYRIAKAALKRFVDEGSTMAARHP